MAAPKGHAPYNINGEGGRPRKYSNDDIERFADELTEWIKEPDNFWVKDFCLEKNINPDFMAEWENENLRFRGSYQIARQMQESRLLKGGLGKKFDSGLTKFSLINHHGWADKTESKITGDGSNPLSCILNVIDGKSSELVDG